MQAEDFAAIDPPQTSLLMMSRIRPVLMDSMPLPEKQSISSISVFQATLSAFGSRNSSSFESTSYTRQLDWSSTIASFLRDADMSRQRTAQFA